jgi:hypothetical protein
LNTIFPRRTLIALSSGVILLVAVVMVSQTIQLIMFAQTLSPMLGTTVL